MPDMIDEKKRSSAWFAQLRDQICASFVKIEHESNAAGSAGEFEYKDTKRASDDGSDAGGGVMAVMRGGRVFEKVGVNISTVYGHLGTAAQNAMKHRNGLDAIQDDPRFWASGVSLVAHMANPKTPAVHMNTRMFWTPHGWWFGGGTDLNPCLPNDEDTAEFHYVLKDVCDRHDAEYYPRFKAWADEYFMIKHWGHARGVGGIFYDDLNTGNWEADFAFTQDVGRAFLDAFLPLTRKHMDKPFTEDDREAQLVYRGKYAEFNLVYDRGTQFGLATGHNPEAVLMSLPPIAKWP